ncbi:MAG: hypothetical protein MN733_20900, partial [Nitrososphaera sp.]|nr:hypothetical protein [Nitrososphaera sp.]
MVFGLFDEDVEEEAPAAQYGQQAFAAAGSEYDEGDIADIEAMQAEQQADIDAQVQEIFQSQEREVESYSQGEVNSATLRTRANNPDPQDPDQEPAFIRSSTNFLFGDEMAIMGIKWDKDGLTWKAETAEEMWSDHPIMSTVALAGIAFPFVGALRKSAKVGKLAVAGAKLASGADEAGMLATAYKAGRAVGILPETLLKHGDDWTKLGDELLDVVDEDAVALGAKTQVLKYFDDDFAAVVKAEADPTKRLEMLGGRKRLQEILLESDKRQRMLDLKATVESGNGTTAQIAQYALQKRFANTYFNIGNRVSKEYVRNMNKFWDNAKLDELFKHELDEEDHLLYFKYLNDKHDPTDFAKLSPVKQQYFERTRNRYWQHQRDAVESGFMTPETVARIGPAHVAALRKGSEAVTEAADVSRKQSILERGGIIRHYPKLKSPTLLERTSTLDEVIDAAARGELITNIEDIHRTSIIKDEMLHLGYKLMRDVALRAGDTATNRYAIKAEAFDALSDTAKKAWVGLDDIPGKGVSARLKRMVAKSLGKTPDEIDRLPYVHQNVIDEMFDPEGGMMMAGHNVANAISLLTAMHKPAKTVFNLPSHGQNIVSNL